MSSPVICPKCRTVRPPDASVPAWQCPACGVAYAKVGMPVRPAAVNMSTSSRPASTALSPAQQRRWVALALLACAALAIYWLYGRALALHSIDGRLDSELSVKQLTALAAKTQPEDVMLYGASWCPHCRNAKQWMHTYGFRFQECDVDKDSACTADFRRFSSDGGIPYLVVKGHHMKQGFDTDEFVAALSQ
jgi:glutaredoxin